jgi:hypothetical protein
MTTLDNAQNVTSISFQNMVLSSQVDEVASDYVFYTGGIAGISDVSRSECDAKPLDRRADKIELERY